MGRGLRFARVCRGLRVRLWEWTLRLPMTRAELRILLPVVRLVGAWEQLLEALRSAARKTPLASWDLGGDEVELLDFLGHRLV